jgi:hypothetical protein
MASTGRRRGALVGLGAAAWSARLGFEDRDNLFLAISVTLSPPFLTMAGTEDLGSGRKTMASRDPFVSEREVKGAMLSNA